MLKEPEYPIYEPVFQRDDPDKNILFVMCARSEEEYYVEIPEEVASFIKQCKFDWKDPVSEAVAQTYNVIGGIPILTIMDLIKASVKSRLNSPNTVPRIDLALPT